MLSLYLYKVSYTFPVPLKRMVPPAEDGNATPSPSSTHGGGHFDSMCQAPRQLTSLGFTPKGKINILYVVFSELYSKIKCVVCNRLWVGLCMWWALDYMEGNRSPIVDNKLCVV